MSYVPGFESDVFISYAHASDQAVSLGSRGWVTELQEDLVTNLEPKLFPAPDIYLDRTGLRKAGAWPEDLRLELRSTAVLLTINCEPYFNSDYCAWELDQFRRRFGNDPRTGSGGRRVLELYKSLRESGRYPLLQVGNTGLWFCKKTEPSRTYGRNDPEYWDALRSLTTEIESLLSEMRKERQCIFLSAPVDDRVDAIAETPPAVQLYRRLKTDLMKDYRVVPPPVIADKDDEYLAMSQLSVHFLSQMYDERTVGRINKARAARQKVLVVLAPDMEKSPGSTMQVFVQRLRQSIEASAQDSPSDLRLVQWVPGRSQPSDLLSEIRNSLKIEPPPPPPTQLSVYMICDPRDHDETEVKKLFRIFERMNKFEEIRALRLTEQEVRKVFRVFQEIRTSQATSSVHLSAEDFRRLFVEDPRIQALDLALNAEETREAYTIFEILLAVSSSADNSDVARELPFSEAEIDELVGILMEMNRLRLTFRPLKSDDEINEHMAKLAACDGSLLLWGSARNDWFKGYVSEFETALAFRGRPLSARTILIKPKGEAKVLYAQTLVPPENLWDGVDFLKLAKFLMYLLRTRPEAYGR